MNWLDIGALDDIPRQGARVVKTAAGCVAVFRTAADAVFAVDDRCPHKDGPLSEGIVHGNAVTCPLHAWVFSLETGQAQGADAGAIATYPARVEAGRILLDASRLVRRVVASPDGKGGISVKDDPDHPANRGRLCSKGSALGETVGLEGRLLAPRVFGQDVGWDEALGLVARRFNKVIAEHGPDAVAFYVSGQMLTEDYYVANKLMKGFIGSANIDTNSRLCMASSVAGHHRAFGTDTVPGLYDDLELADLVVLTGSNLAWCRPVLYQRIAAAKAARPAMKGVQ